MKSILKVVILVIIVFIILHYRKYRFYTDKYQIDQQELEYIKGDDLYSQYNPLIVTFIENTSLKNNVQMYKLFSILSFNKAYKYYKFQNNAYNMHRNEILFIRSKVTTNVELINPKYKKYFSKKDHDIFEKYTLNKKHYKDINSIDIVLREYNILFIPRHWLFKLSVEDKTEIFMCDNPISYMSKRLV